MADNPLSQTANTPRNSIICCTLLLGATPIFKVNNPSGYQISMDSMYVWGGIVFIVFLSVAFSLISQWIRAHYRARKSDVDARLSALEAQTGLD